MTITVRRFRLGSALCALLTISFASILALTLFMSADQNAVALPAVLIVTMYSGFALILFYRLKRPIFGEVGFVFLGITTAYSVIPALNFLVLDFDFPADFDGLNFAVLEPKPVELGVHLLRHGLFVVSAAAGYLLSRGSSAFSFQMKVPTTDRIVLLCIGLLLMSTCVVSVLSAPVANYYEHYTRFESLPAVARYIAYSALILKVSSVYLTLLLMFSHYEKFKVVILPFIAILVVYEMSYSFGSRIESFFILLNAACLYHLLVKPVRLGRGALYLFLLLVFFTIIEFYRASNFDLAAAIEEFAQRGVKFASEFGAVFYTSFHIYHERANGLLPTPEALMLVNDFFVAIPSYEKVQFNSQYWYAGIYFPDAVVPPQTMGPLADSGIWGGEWDLAIRGVLTGVVYGSLARWALRPLAQWYHVLLYAFLFATAILGIKYSVIYQISQMIRFFAPVFFALAVYVFLSRLFLSKKSP